MAGVSVTAKVKIEAVEPVAHDENQVQLTFVPDYDNDANQEWARHTPSLRLVMVVKKDIGDKFKPFNKYTLTFTEDSTKDSKANG